MGLQDGRHRRNHGAMAATLEKNVYIERFLRLEQKPSAISRLKYPPPFYCSHLHKIVHVFFCGNKYEQNQNVITSTSRFL